MYTMDEHDAMVVVDSEKVRVRLESLHTYTYTYISIPRNYTIKPSHTLLAQQLPSVRWKVGGGWVEDPRVKCGTALVQSERCQNTDT